MTSSDGETNQGGKLFSIPFFHMGTLIKGGFAMYSNLFKYTQSPFIRTSLIRLSAEFLGKFKTRALGGSNLRTTSNNLRTASAQIFKAKNQFVDESIVDGPQERSK